MKDRSFRRFVLGLLWGRLSRQTARTFILEGIAAAIYSLAMLLMARLMGAKEYGVFSYGFGWMRLVALLLSSALSFWVMRAAASGSYGQTGWVLRRGLRMAFYGGIVSAGVVSLVSLMLPLEDVRYGVATRLVVWGGVWLAALYCFRGFFQGLRMPEWAVVASPLSWNVFLFAAFVLLWFADMATAENVALAVGMGGALVFALFYPFVDRLSKKQANSLKISAAGTAEGEHQSRGNLPVWLLLYSSLQTVGAQLPLLALGSWAQPLEIANYALAWRLASLYTLITSAIGGVVAPLLTRAYMDGDVAYLRRLAGIVTFIMTVTALLFGVCGVVGVTLFREFFLPSKEYPYLIAFFLVFSAVWLLHGIMGPTAYLLLCAYRERLAVFSSLLGILSCCVVLLFPHIKDVWTGVIALAVFQVAWKVTSLLYVRKVYGFYTTSCVLYLLKWTRR